MGAVVDRGEGVPGGEAVGSGKAIGKDLLSEAKVSEEQPGEPAFEREKDQKGKDGIRRSRPEKQRSLFDF